LNNKLLENAICSHCMQIKRFVQAEEPIYHAAGKSRKLVNLCLPSPSPPQNTTDAVASSIDESCCYYRYYNDLGYNNTLIVAGWMEETYNNILNVYISCPLLYLTLGSSSNGNGDTTLARRTTTTTTTTTTLERQGEEEEGEKKPGLALSEAVKIAYLRNPIVRKYLEAVDYQKVPHILDINSNPRLFPIRYRLTYEEPLLVKVCDEPLMFRWSEI
jgi:hypothetical protein